MLQEQCINLSGEPLGYLQRFDAKVPNVAAEKLKSIEIAIFKAAGASEEEAEIVADHLVTSNLYGHDSHGVLRTKAYVRMIRKMQRKNETVWIQNSPGIKLGARLKIVKETSIVLRLDADWGFGQVMVRRAAEMAVQKARTNGICVVSMFNCNHTGRLGTYTEIVARHDMIGIATNSGSPLTAPYGSIDPIYSGSPISVAIPTSGRPILMDMATSAVAAGKISAAAAKGEMIPLGWLIDSEGRPTTDPKDLRTEFGSKAVGALLPLGGAKGSALNLVVDILGGLLSGSGFSKEGKGQGVFMMAIDIATFRPIHEFKREADKLIQLVKNSRKAPGFKEILIAGEPEYRSMEKKLKEGIYVEDATWETMKQIARELNVDIEGILA